MQCPAALLATFGADALPAMCCPADFIDSQQAAGDAPGVSNTAPPAAGSVSFKPPVTRQLSRCEKQLPPD